MALINIVRTLPYADVYLVGGPSGAGKTTFARILAREKRGLLLPLDSYFVDEKDVHTSFSLQFGRGSQWDHPSSVDRDLAAQNITELLDGRCARMPIFSFTKNKRVGHRQHELLQHKSIIVEGVHALKLQSSIHEISRTVFGIFITAAVDVRRSRIRRRDAQNRNRPLRDFERRFYFMRIAETRWILPQRRLADLILDTTHGEFGVVDK
ncbi:MAG TPA: AAA family ATPase [Pyrinomonadaceae bacterium]|nr:AAA family ATPase [Pyrinomonadaceae bacterium]